MPSSCVKNIQISQIQKKELFSLARFVFEENCRRHNKLNSANNNLSEIISLYTEDLRSFFLSKYYAAYNNQNEIIGSVKVTKWNRVEILPIQRDFDIDLLNISFGIENTNFYHVGRFAGR